VERGWEEHFGEDKGLAVLEVAADWQELMSTAAQQLDLQCSYRHTTTPISHCRLSATSL